MGSISATTNFLPVRACIFDMDGLLINTEDIYTNCANEVLARHGRPALPWSIKAQLMGVPGSSTGPTFLAWAQLPISHDQFKLELKAEQRLQFPTCEALPGVVTLLQHLQGAETVTGEGVHVALASSSERANFELKTSKNETGRLFNAFSPQRRVLGDDPRLIKGRGKPHPDIFLLALKTINDSLSSGEKTIRPEECLVFEDSIPGVEAGRRAGMRVAWVPHQELLREYEGKEQEVLTGNIGLVKVEDEWDGAESGDGWGVLLNNLENFPYGAFGIRP